MHGGFHILDSQKFDSARGNSSLIDVARIQTGDHRAFVVRISIELRCFAKIEVWDTFSLGWKELHTIVLPLVLPSIDKNIEALASTGIAILRGAGVFKD